MPNGRPPMFETDKELRAKIAEYFETGCLKVVVDDNGDVRSSRYVPTITGLSLYLGFCDRYSFYQYEKKPEFTYTIKRARATITQHFEELAQGNNVAGPIFMLKNFGYSDKSELDINARVTKMDKITKDGQDLEFDIGEPKYNPNETDTTDA